MPEKPVWLMEVISTSNKIDLLQTKVNISPATVGEYYENYLKK